jgi:membrane protease YdiL (CAAX protease family)
MEKANALESTSSSLNERFNLAFGLTALIWITGLVGHFTPLLEWPALALYVIGSIAVVIWRGKSKGEWAEMYLAGGDRGKSLKWGGIAGGILFCMFNTVMRYKSGKPPMMDMQGILVNMNFLYFFPVLVLAEEFLWRGLMLSSMVEKGINPHLSVFVTAICYVLNHYAVAPVGMQERGLMAMMAFPIGILGGYIVLKSKNVWGSVLVHMVTMFSMILDIFVIPNLVYSYFH